MVHLGIGLSWSLVSNDGLADLRARLDPNAANLQTETVQAEIA